MKNLGILLLCLCWLGTNATSWRVNNNPAINADFSTLQEAHEAAASGDTLYIEGSHLNYGDWTISKQLVIIGPGYYLLENDSTQANIHAAVIDEFTIDSTASGSHIYGCQFYSVTMNGSNIVFSRNRVTFTSGIMVGSNNDVVNCLISQNYTTTISGRIYNWHSQAHNTQIYNNYVSRDITFPQSAVSSVVINNVVGRQLNVRNSIVKNNIHYGTSYGIEENSGNTFAYNLTARNTIPPGVGNQTNIDPSDVFIDYDGSLGYSTDGKWQLNPDGPAAGAGENGIDCGMFGGVTPYVLSGLAPIPRIYEAEVPISGSAATGLPVTIKVKSQN